MKGLTQKADDILVHVSDLDHNEQVSRLRYGSVIRTELPGKSKEPLSLQPELTDHPFKPMDHLFKGIAVVTSAFRDGGTGL